MAWDNRTLSRRPSDPRVPRILVVGHGYRCGMCGKTFGKSHLANECLRACLQDYLVAGTIEAFVSGLKDRFRCSFCHKVYLNREDGLACVDGCRARLSLLWGFDPAEIEVDVVYAKTTPDEGNPLGDRPVSSDPTKPKREHTGDDLPSAPVLTVRREGARRLAPPQPVLSGGVAAQLNWETVQFPTRSSTSQPGKILPSAPQPRQRAQSGKPPSVRHSEPKARRRSPEPTPQHDLGENEVKNTITQELSRRAPHPDPAPPTDIAPPPSSERKPGQAGQEKVLYRQQNQKPFTRDGAQYVCTVCMKKYFTKIEVEQCFKGHPLPGQDGLDVAS